MGRNRVVIDENHFIIYGFDPPCNGYFAEFYDNEENKDEPVDQIGFFKGVNKNQVIEFFEKHECLELVKKQKPKVFENLLLDLPC